MSDAQLDSQRQYYQERIEDMQDTMMDMVRLMADVVSELRTEIELLRADKMMYEEFTTGEGNVSV